MDGERSHSELEHIFNLKDYFYFDIIFTEKLWE